MASFLFKGAWVESTYANGSRRDLVAALDDTTWGNLHAAIAGDVATLGAFRYSVVTGSFRTLTGVAPTERATARDVVTTTSLAAFSAVQDAYLQLNGDSADVPDLTLILRYHRARSYFAGGGTRTDHVLASTAGAFTTLQAALVAAEAGLGAFRYSLGTSHYARSDSPSASLRIYTVLPDLTNPTVTAVQGRVVARDGEVLAGAGGGGGLGLAPTPPAYTSLPAYFMDEYDFAQRVPLHGRQYTCFPKYAESVWGAPGDWRNADGTDKGAVPSATDDVYVGDGATVTIDDQAAVCRNLIVDEDGAVEHATDADTRLTVTTFLVAHHGAHRIGTAAAPVGAAFAAEIVFRDSALDTTADPNRTSNGYLTMGAMSIHGTPKTPFLRLAANALAGATTLTLGSGQEDPWDTPSAVPGTVATSLAAGTYRVSHTIADATGETRPSPELVIAAGPVANPASAPTVDATYAVDLANPAVTPTVNSTGGGATGGLLAAGTYRVASTFATPFGETAVGPVSATFVVAAGNQPVVTLPALPSGATGINLYITPKASAASISDGSILWIYRKGITAETATMNTAQPAISRARPPAVNATAGALAAGTYKVVYTWSNAGGETLASPQATVVVAAGDVPRVTLPSLPAGASAANLYVSEAGGTTPLLYRSGITATTTLLDVAIPPAPGQRLEPDAHNALDDPIAMPRIGTPIATGGALAAGTYRVRYSWTGPMGETVCSQESADFTVTSGQIPVVRVPPVPASNPTITFYLSPPGESPDTARSHRYLAGLAGSTTGWTSHNLAIAAPTRDHVAPVVNTTGNALLLERIPIERIA